MFTKFLQVIRIYALPDKRFKSAENVKLALKSKIKVNKMIKMAIGLRTIKTF